MREAGAKEKGALKTARIKFVPRDPLAKPAWIRVRAPMPDSRFHEIKRVLREQRLHTVCEEASCPNIAECFGNGTATFMILGDICTRRCPFCDVAHGRPLESAESRLGWYIVLGTLPAAIAGKLLERRIEALGNWVMVGSLVVLGPGSRLTMAAGYDDPARLVALRGEALFQVRHDGAHPFAVRAADAEIRDLGTTFTVRSDDDGVRVAVVSGSVQLQDTTKRAPRVLTLKAGDAAVLGKDRQAPVRVGPRREEDLAWTHGRLVFKDASLARVRDDLRRWYGIELVLADSSLASRHLKAEFAGEPPDQVLKTIEFALGGVTIERRGDTAIVRLQKPTLTPP